MRQEFQDIRELAQKYLNGTATEEERARLHDWYDTVHAGDTEIVVTETETNHAVFGREMLAEIQSRMQEERRFPWFKLAAAAIILLVLGAGTWLFVANSDRQPSNAVAVSGHFGDDVAAPQTTKAVLTLADGSTIQLDSAGSGVLAMQGNVQVTKQEDGQIGYQAANGAAQEATGLNTLQVPYGSKPIAIGLADGTRVWLDAGTTLVYPVAFNTASRNVHINGQAYFEVAHNPNAPFIVEKNGLTIQVLGTHFNVNAYDDEPNARITLLEGAVKLSRNQESILLKPGQQALADNHLSLEKEVDLDAVMAWKDGRFELNGNTIEPIMKQVTRWYGVEVVYQGAIPTDNFVGSVSRMENVSELLKILEQTQAVKFSIEGKKITVMKK